LVAEKQVGQSFAAETTHLSPWLLERFIGK
jgi:hypothetical protein